MNPCVRLAYNPGPVNTYRAFDALGGVGKPDVRLAFHPEGDRTLKQGTATPAPSGRLALVNSPAERNGTLDNPAVRLAISPHGEQGGANSVEHHVGAAGLGHSPTVRLAHKEAQGTGTLTGQMGKHQVPKIPDSMAPALLVSYVYLEPFLKNQHRYCYRDWVLDSGAFSAHNSGTEIKLQDYIDKAKELLAKDPTLTEVFALDVIGDWKASLKNTEEMWRQGVPAIPCWHAGEPEDALKGMAKDYPKIALGGVAKTRAAAKKQIAEQVFARVWPKKIHGFGFGSEDMVMAFPWHSVDATNWEMGPCAFGRWNTYGKMSVRGSKQNLRVEVEYYLEMERKARIKWRKQMEELEVIQAPVVRRAAQQAGNAQIKRSGIVGGGGDPCVRLAEKAGSRPNKFLVQPSDLLRPIADTQKRS